MSGAITERRLHDRRFLPAADASGAHFQRKAAEDRAATAEHERNEAIAVLLQMHSAVDLLMAKLIARDEGFSPTKSAVWPAVVASSNLLMKAGLL